MAAVFQAQDWRWYLTMLRMNGTVDAQQATHFSEFLDTHARKQAAAADALASEHRMRCALVGKDAADQWMEEASKALAIRDREEVLRVAAELGIPETLH